MVNTVMEQSNTLTKHTHLKLYNYVFNTKLSLNFIILARNSVSKFSCRAVPRPLSLDTYTTPVKCFILAKIHHKMGTVL